MGLCTCLSCLATMPTRGHFEQMHVTVLRAQLVLKHLAAMLQDVTRVLRANPRGTPPYFM
jgi:hypothetical protein